MRLREGVKEGEKKEDYMYVHLPKLRTSTSLPPIPFSGQGIRVGWCCKKNVLPPHPIS